MSLYTDTPDHAHAALSEKEAYLSMPAAQRCVHLAGLCDKAFDYCTSVAFELSDEGDVDTWEASLWPGAGEKRPIADVLVAVNMCPPKGAVITSARLEVDNQRAWRPAVCLSEAEGATVSVPYDGVPLVALQYAAVKVRVRCPTHPGDATVRYRVLPQETRRWMARTSHELTVIAAPHRGGRVKISSGDMWVRSCEFTCECGCAVM